MIIRKPRARPAPVLFASIALVALALACGGEEEEVASDTTTTTPPSRTSPEAQATTPSFPAVCLTPPAVVPSPAVKQYNQKPALTINPANQYIAHVTTTRGHFFLELRPDLAPKHVNAFVFLVNEGFYNGVTFHRVVPGFVAQTGDPTGSGSGGPGYSIPLEPSDEPFVRGVVGMARTSDPDSAGSQWFVTLGDASHLNNQYTVFGQVTQGMEIVECIEQADAITSVYIEEKSASPSPGG